MNEHPDDWYDDLLEREHNPDFERPSSIAGDIKDHAADYAKDKAKDYGKKLAKEASKTAAKEGTKAGVEAGASAAAGSGGAAATGAGVAATTGVETAGIGVVVGAVIAILGNKKLRRIALGLIAFNVLLYAALAVITAIMPILIITAFVKSASEAISNSTIVRGGEMVVEGLTNVAGAVGDTIDKVKPYDGLIPGHIGPIGYNEPNPTVAGNAGQNATLASATTTPTQSSQSQVLPASTISTDSRISKLYAAMYDKGYFAYLNTKYGLHIKSSDNGHTYKIFIKNKLIKTVHSQAAVANEFKTNPDLREIIQQSLKDDLKITQYSDRVTIAESGLASYNTNQLFLPGGDKAKTDNDVTTVTKGSLKTVNNPFVSTVQTELPCDCGDMIPRTILEDSGQLIDSISNKTGFRPDGTLYSRMKKRVAEDSGVTFFEWYNYVKLIAQTAEITNKDEIANNAFIQGTLKTRKTQSTREWLHWRTVVDQYKAGKLTAESSAAMFKNFSGGASSKAYRYVSGQAGGIGFKKYEKINGNTANPVREVYRNWLQENPEQAAIVTDALDSFWIRFISHLGALGDYIASHFSTERKQAVAEAGFELGSQIMLPICDGSRDNTRFTNCLYAGAQSVAHDVGISNYGHSGTISKEEYDKVANYTGEIDQRIAAKRPLMERLTSLDNNKSFARTLLLQAAVPIADNDQVTSYSSYLAKIPETIGRLAVTALNPSASAAEDETTLNNINRTGIKLRSLLDTPVSSSLDNSSGDVNSCPTTAEDQENLCRADETTWLALAAKFDLLPQDLSSGESPGSTFVIGTYNQKRSLDAAHHTGAINNITRDDVDMDVVGTQETTDPKYSRYKSTLAERGYGVFPDRNYGNRYVNQTCSYAQSIFYKKSKFTFVKGEWFEVPRYPDPAQNCEGGETTTAGHGTDGGKLPSVWTHIPVVWLQDAATGQPIIVINTHNVANVAGAAGTSPAYSRYISDQIYVQQIQRLKRENPNVPIFFTGDFNEGTGVRDSGNVTYQGKYQNLLFCMFSQNGLMKSVEQRMGCPTSGSDVDFIYTSPNIEVEWHKSIASGGADSGPPSYSDHSVLYAKVTVPKTESDGSLRIATFNILHVGPDPYESQWRTRFPKSIQTLKDNQITVAGLQEVRPEQHHLLNTESYVTDTYDNWPKDENNPGFTPNPIIWNKSMFSMVPGSGKRLSIEYDNGSKIDHAVQIKLQDNAGHQFYVLNTHDPANARPGSDQQNALSRLHNTQFYVQHFADLKQDGIPILFTGDFNASYTMSGNQKPYNNDPDNLAYCVISRGGVMKNVWDIFQNKPFRCPRSSVPEGAPIDHIYVTGIQDVGKVWTAPDHQNGSDHPTVMAAIKMPWDQGGDSGNLGDTGSGDLRWPVNKRFWTTNRREFLDPHNGAGTFTSPGTNGVAVDIGLPKGTPVYAMADGTVIKKPLGRSSYACSGNPNVSNNGGIEIRSRIQGGTLTIAYAHGYNVTNKTTVKAGEKIMDLGEVGNACGPHLHLDMSFNNKNICPQDVFLSLGAGNTPNLSQLASRARPPCGR